MLKTSDLFCGYEGKPILNNINLRIPENEIHGLIGLNGAGKSTLLKTLLGLLKPINGKVILGEESIAAMPPQLRAEKICMLESDPRSAFSITPRDLFELQTNKNQAMQNRAIDRLEVSPLLDKDLLQLSAGQAKRVWLAHTLSLGAQVILIDEPFLHLDWHQQNKFMETVKLWKAEYGSTFVLALHELDLATRFCDKLSVIHNKKLQLTDSTKSVLTSPTLSEIFAFKVLIDDNPIDGSQRLTLGLKK